MTMRARHTGRSSRQRSKTIRIYSSMTQAISSGSRSSQRPTIEPRSWVTGVSSQAKYLQSGETHSMELPSPTSHLTHVMSWKILYHPFICLELSLVTGDSHPDRRG